MKHRTRGPVVAPRADKLAELGSLATRRNVEAAVLIDGKVNGVDERGVAHAVLAGGEAIEARCPAHVETNWLREAAKITPVSAAFALVRPSGRYVLWGIFPDGAHSDVKVDVALRGRHVRVEADSLSLDTPKAHLRFEPDGNVNVKGRDVTSHARRVNRIKGGSIRLN